MRRGWGARLLITACAVVLGGCGVADEGASGAELAADASGGGSDGAVHEAATAPLRFVAAADATARAAYPSSNYATQSTLNVDRSPDEEVFLRFQVSGASAGVSKAVLRLYTTNGSSAGPALYATGGSWSESSLTWNSRPARTSASLGTKNPSTSTYVEYDVTSIVRGDGAFGFVLVPTSTDGADFASRESSDATRRPELVVTLAGSEPPPPPPPSGSEVRFVASADATIQQTYPTTNYGRTTTLLSDTSPGESAFIRFTVSGLATTVSRAEVRLYVTNGSSNGPALYAANNSWVETAVTWSNRPSRISAALGDHGAISTGQWITYDVSSVVKSNGDFTFELGATSTDGTDVSSREASDSSRRPVLVLSVDGGTPPPPPPPPPATQTVTVGASEDTTVLEAYPYNSYGNATTLQSDGSPRELAYLRFVVPRQAGRIIRARMRLYVTNGSSDGPELYRAPPAFTESTTWANQPWILFYPIANAGAVATGTWMEFDVSGAVNQQGTYDFALHGTSSDGLDVASSEYGDATRRPQLVLTVDTSTQYIQKGTSFSTNWAANGPITQDAATEDLFVALAYSKDFAVMRVTDSGSTLWVRQFTVRDPYGTDDDSFGRIAQLLPSPDGSFRAIARVRMGQAELDGRILPGGDHLVHFSPSGAIQHVFQIPQEGGSGYTSAVLGAVARAADGDLVVTGCFSGTADFGGDWRTTATPDQSWGYIARYSPTLAVRWVRTFTSDSVACGKDVAVAANGDVLVGAYVHGVRTSFDGAPLPDGVAEEYRGFAFRLSAAGALQWHKVLPYSADHVAFTQLGTAVVAAHDQLFVYEVNGAFRFSRDFGDGYELIRELSVDDSGSVRVVAQGQNVNLGAGIDGLDQDRLYIGRINLDGEHRWTFSGPAASSWIDFAYGPAVYLRGDGVAYVAGTFHGSTRYDDWGFFVAEDTTGLFILKLAP